MAGRISLDLARRQGFTKPCSEVDEGDFYLPRPLVTRAEPEPDDFAKGPGWITHPKATRRLRRYWTTGKGAAKIGWFTDGSMRRCIRLLRKYLPKNAAGYCANLHKYITGEWPREGIIPS